MSRSTGIRGRTGIVRFRTWTVAAMCLALAIGTAACGGDPQSGSDNSGTSNSKGDSGENSRPEGEGASGGKDDPLVIYSGREEELVGPIIEQFEADTGVTVLTRYGDTARLAAQILEEGERTPADVFFSQDAGALGALAKADRLQPLPDEILDRVPEGFRAGDGTWTGTSGRARVIVYDPRELDESEVPDSVYELTDDKWQGKVGMPPSNASFQAFVTAIRTIDGDQAAEDWLSGMAANDFQAYDNNNLTLDAVNAGQIQLGLINHYYWYERVAEEGLEKFPARLKFPGGGDPGALVNVAGAGVLKGSARPDEAQRFVEYLLSDTGQQHFAENTKEYPLVDGIEPSADLPPLSELEQPDIDLSDLDELEVTLEMIERTGVL